VTRLWLLDLARELDASTHDDTMPALALDRVWITRESHAMLLDIGGPARSVQSPQAFLAEIAAAALEAGPLPLSARTTLDALARDGVPSGTLVKRMSDLVSGPDHLTAWRRSVALGLANVPTIMVVIAMIALVPLLSRVVRQDFLLPFNCLVEVNKAEVSVDAQVRQLRPALATYCSATYGRTYTDDGYWRDWRGRQLTAALHPVATRVVADYPVVSAADAASAAIATRETLNEDEVRQGSRSIVAILLALPSMVLLLCFVLSLLSTLIVRGGVVMRLLGIAVVDRQGLLVSRAMAAWRVLVAWSPTVLLWLYVGPQLIRGREPEEAFIPVWLIILPIAATMAGAIWTVAHPSRGLHDRIVGTSVVPR
jgi:hypothetical protein